MKPARQGKVVIFNHEVFDTGLGLESRHGTREDKNGLRKLFQRLNFTVRCYNDRTKKEIMKILMAERRASVLSSRMPGVATSASPRTPKRLLIVVVLTHGGAGGVLCAQDDKYNEKDLFRIVCCQELQDTNKGFIIQACRNGPRDGSEGDSIEHLDNTNTLIARSTQEGSPSARCTKTGSIFIQAFCKELSNLRENNLCSVLVRTMVHVDKQTSGRQIPAYELNIDDAILLKHTWGHEMADASMGCLVDVKYDQIMAKLRQALLLYLHDVDSDDAVYHVTDLDRVQNIIFSMDIYERDPKPGRLFRVYANTMKFLRDRAIGRKYMRLLNISAAPS